MNCSKCGTQNLDGVTICGSCGALIESPVQQKPQETYQQEYQNAGAGNQQQAGQYGANNSFNTYSAPIGNPSNGGMVPPKNYMVEAIIVTVISFACCCSPISVVLGIIAIVKSNNVKSDFEMGNINGAIDNADSAKNLTIWAAVITGVFVVIGIIYYLIMGIAGINEIFRDIR